MKCQDVIIRLQDYVLGDVSKEEKLSIENHLMSCQKCQKEEQITRWLVLALESDVVKEPSAHFIQSVVEKLPERIPALSMKPLFAFLFLVLGSLFGVGLVFREALLRLVNDFHTSITNVLAGLDPDAFVASFLMSRATTMYFVSLGFVCLSITITVIWFARYYWAPVQYRSWKH